MEHRFAKRSLGQNFLVDRNVVEKIISALSPTAADIILEIGPGRGALTAHLIERSKVVYALEFDTELVLGLRERFAESNNILVIEDDALSFDFRRLKESSTQLRLVANLPYNISTAILQRLVEYVDVFSDSVLMFHREVLDRITAEPGTKDRGYLTVKTEAYFKCERLFDVPPSAFRPVPKVWSSVVRLVPKMVLPDHPESFDDLLSHAFVHKRKTIYNNLKLWRSDIGGILSQIGISADRRAETLTLDEWIQLGSALHLQADNPEKNAN